MTDFNPQEHYQHAFAQQQAKKAEIEVAWLTQLRETAMAEFVQRGLPTRKDEEWKYTSVMPLSQQAFVPSERAPLSQIELPDPLQIDAYRCVFIDGHFNAELSTLPQSVSVSSLHDALNRDDVILKNHLSHLASAEANGFQALNLAFLQDGAVITVNKGCVLEKPIEMLHWQRDTNTVSHYHHLIIAEPASQVSVIETFFGSNDVVSFANTVTEIFLGEQAIINHAKIILDSQQGFHIGHTSVAQARDSQFHSEVFTLSGRIVRSDLTIEFTDTGASATLNGLYIGHDQQHIDHHTTVHHAKPHCTSDEFYKGILDDKSHAVFNGKVIVAKHAQKTDASQQNKNLLLSKTAAVDTKPQLEIFADDVKCAHGATVGQLDDKALFYCQSRGISFEEAQDLLTHAFAGDILERVRLPQLQQALTRLIANKMS